LCDSAGVEVREHSRHPAHRQRRRTHSQRHDRLDIDAEELELGSGMSHHHHSGEKIAIPDTPYDRDFWGEVDDGGVAG